MKRIVSVSLGSSTRNHKVETEMLGQPIVVERIGTDGDVNRAMQMIRDLDGKVDAIGLGGIDLYIYAGEKRYTFREALKLKNCAKITPVVDGSGLKNTLERRVIEYLSREKVMNFKGKRVLMVSAMDRFGMAEALVNYGASLLCGDFIFGLKIPLPIYSLKTLARLARIVAPIVVNFPIKMLYPTGSSQDYISPKYRKYYQEADIIAGDFLFIRKYMPETLEQKTIITNTVTNADVESLKRRGVKMLITTTPELNGRSFGTNVMEGILVALAGKPLDLLTVQDYHMLLDKIGLLPRIVDFSKQLTS